MDRLGDRQSLLGDFDKLRRDVDASGPLEGLDTITQQAFGILTSSRLADALDFRKKIPKCGNDTGKASLKTSAMEPPEILNTF